MKRRNLLKTAVAAPLVSALPVAAEEYEFFYNFQDQIWRDYLAHDFNLFIMPPATGKTHMSNYIRQWWKDRQVDKPNEMLLDNCLEQHRGRLYLCDKKVMLWDDNLGFCDILKMTIFATLSGDKDIIEGYHRIAMSGLFNDRRFPASTLEEECPMPVFHQSKPENYMREYECRFFPKKVRIIA